MAHTGGESGMVTLERSEIRAMIADPRGMWDMPPDQRAAVVKNLMWIVENAKSLRHKMTAIKGLAELDRIGLERRKQDADALKTPAPSSINVSVDARSVNVVDRIAELTREIQQGASRQIAEESQTHPKETER